MQELIVSYKQRVRGNTAAVLSTVIIPPKGFPFQHRQQTNDNGGNPDEAAPRCGATFADKVKYLTEDFHDLSHGAECQQDDDDECYNTNNFHINQCNQKEQDILLLYQSDYLNFVETLEGGFLSLAVETGILDSHLNLVRVAGTGTSRVYDECSTCRHVAMLLLGCDSESCHNDNKNRVKLFFADNTAKLSHIYISVGVGLYVLSVTCKQQVEYIVAIEVTHPQAKGKMAKYN